MKQIKNSILVFVIALGLLIVIPGFQNTSNAAIPFNTIVAQAATSAKLNKTKAYVIKGKTVKLKVKNANSSVVWSSKNKKIATVNSKGIVTGKKKGKTIIIAKIGKQELKCTIVVETPKISNKTTSITIFSSKTLKVKGTKQKIKWKSSNKAVATVSSKGKVTAKKLGKATITATVGNKKYTCKVTVKDTAKGANFTKLKNYINNYGRIDDNGNRYICDSHTWYDEEFDVTNDYYTEIHFTNGKLWFIEIIESDNAPGFTYTAFTVEKYSNEAYVYFSECPENGDQDEELDKEFDASSYNYSQLYFNKINVSQYVEENYYQYNNWCNSSLWVAMDDNDILLRSIGFTMNDFGFYNYGK